MICTRRRSTRSTATGSPTSNRTSIRRSAGFAVQPVHHARGVFRVDTDEIANATTSTNGDLTLVDISDNINSFDAFIGALDHGIGSSGLFESLFQSLELYLTNMFYRGRSHRTSIALCYPRAIEGAARLGEHLGV